MITLNDILQLEDLKKVKVRFNLRFADKKRPAIDYYTDSTEESHKMMMDGQYWNYGKKGNFKEGYIALGFIPVPSKLNCWLLFHVGKVTKDLNVRNGVGYDYEDIDEYQKYIGRIIIRFKNKSQNMVRNGESVMKECEIEEILPKVYDNDFFPGYNNVNVSWLSLKTLITKDSWRTALCNQKGVYLLTDTKTGKHYVGSAYGQNMILGRWEEYIQTGHGGNKLLKELKFEHIKENFRFTILETFNQNASDETIIARESFWKEVLLTRNKKFGYNDN